MDPNAGEPVNPGQVGGVGAATPDISRVEDVVTAAQQAAGISTRTPQEQFKNQFDSVQPSIAEAPVAPLDPSIDNLSDLLAKGPQVVEIEKTPADELRDKISAAVDNFLAEVTKEKVAA